MQLPFTRRHSLIYKTVVLNFYWAELLLFFITAVFTAILKIWTSTANRLIARAY